MQLMWWFESAPRNVEYLTISWFDSNLSLDFSLSETVYLNPFPQTIPFEPFPKLKCYLILKFEGNRICCVLFDWFYNILIFECNVWCHMCLVIWSHISSHLILPESCLLFESDLNPVGSRLHICVCVCVCTCRLLSSYYVFLCVVSSRGEWVNTFSHSLSICYRSPCRCWMENRLWIIIWFCFLFCINNFIPTVFVTVTVFVCSVMFHEALRLFITFDHSGSWTSSPNLNYITLKVFVSCTPCPCPLPPLFLVFLSLPTFYFSSLVFEPHIVCEE